MQGTWRWKAWRGIRFVVGYELRLWADLFRWVTRRPIRVRPGETLHPYVGTVRMLLIVFIVVSAIEIPIVHLILPWQTARQILLAVGIYGLLWMVGLLASQIRNPHRLGPDGVRIQSGVTGHVFVPLDAIGSARVRRRSLPPGGSNQIEEVGDARILSLGIGNQTSIDLLLDRALTVPVRKTGGKPVTEIRMHTDDPGAFVAAASELLAARRPLP